MPDSLFGVPGTGLQGSALSIAPNAALRRGAVCFYPYNYLSLPRDVSIRQRPMSSKPGSHPAAKEAYLLVKAIPPTLPLLAKRDILSGV